MNRDTERSDTERDDALFVNLILIFQGAAMQQMGKIINPLTGKIDKNLEQARFSIDTLAMLKEKTRGNLSADLDRLLDSTLFNLRMNYVEEAAREEKVGKEETEEKPAKEMAGEDKSARDRDSIEKDEAERSSEKPPGDETIGEKVAGGVTRDRGASGNEVREERSGEGTARREKMVGQTRPRGESPTRGANSRAGGQVKGPRRKSAGDGRVRGK